MRRHAILSDDKRFRYLLWRSWDQFSLNPGCCFVMLNPSTADDKEDDPTIRRCIGYATAWGFPAMHVVNLFAYRATSPADLKRAGFEVGEQNDTYIERAVEKCHGNVVCAWGVNARGQEQRVAQVMKVIRSAGGEPKALGFSSDHIPLHPLMLPKTAQRMDYIWRRTRT